jgi:hypothetical protein
MRLGEASGPWKALAQYDPHTSKTTGALPEGFAFQHASPRSGGSLTEVYVVHPVGNLQLRVLAIDSDGREHATQRTGVTRTDTRDEDQFGVQNLPLEKTRSFRLEAREYQWVEFGNIALNPGAGPVASSQPAAAGQSAGRRATAKLLVMSTAEDHAQGKFHWRVEPDGPLSLVFRCPLSKTPDGPVEDDGGTTLGLPDNRPVEIEGSSTIAGLPTIVHFRVFYPSNTPGSGIGLADMGWRCDFGIQPQGGFTGMAVTGNLTRLTEDYVPFAWAPATKNGRPAGIMFHVLRVVAPERAASALDNPTPRETLRVPGTEVGTTQPAAATQPARTVTYRMSSTEHPDQGERVMVKDGRERMEYDGKVFIRNLLVGKSMLLDPAHKTATIATLVDAPFAMFTARNIEKIGDPGRFPTVSMGKKQIAGREAEGLKFDVGAQQRVAWRDAATHRPVEIEFSGVSNTGRPMHTTYSDIAFDVPLDDSLFAIEVPPGYQRVEGARLGFQMEKDPASQPDTTQPDPGNEPGARRDAETQRRQD